MGSEEYIRKLTNTERTGLLRWKGACILTITPLFSARSSELAEYRKTIQDQITRHIDKQITIK
jgi:hypothetical protein